MRNSAKRYVSTYKAKFHGCIEGSHGESQAQVLEGGPTGGSLIYGEGVQWDTTRSARDTEEDHRVVGRILNQGRPDVGSNKQLRISRQQTMILFTKDLLMSGLASNVTR